MKSKTPYLTVIILFIIFIGFVLIIKSIDSKKAKAAQQCGDNPPGGILYFVVDASDTLRYGDKDFIIQDIKKQIRNTSMGTKIILLKPNGDSADEPHTYFTMCTTWETNWQHTLISSVAEDKEMERTQQAFLDSSQQNLNILLKRQITSQSPLLETLIYITNDYNFINSEKNKIYIYSDMLQNSPRLTWYYTLNKKAKHSTRKPTEGTIPDIGIWGKANFKNATIHIKCIKRFGSHVKHGKAISKSDAEVESFWMDWIKANHGRGDWRR